MTSRPPRIGLTTYRERAAWGVWDEQADLLPTSYSNQVAAAGGLPFLLPPARPDAAAAAVALDGLHGLILTGGADVDPARYSADRHDRTGTPRTDRDGWEITLALAAIESGMPLLAICRGMQVLNVALGGDLDQHLPDVVGHERHRPVVGQHGRHNVRLAENSRVAAILGAQAMVATYHHQGVRTLGTGLESTGWADDGTVEAVEGPGTGWIVGVQWHPEVHDDGALFDAFLDACTQYRDELIPV